MNSDKLVKLIAVIGVMILIAIVFYGNQITNTPVKLSGVGDSPSYPGSDNTRVVNTTQVCSSISSTIQETSTGRTSFMVSMPAIATNTVTVCKGSPCVANTSGIILVPAISSTTSRGYYEQTDSYIGIYTCISTNSTTLGVSYSQ